jgi:putative SOS response-associated peptidase YedK
LRYLVKPSGSRRTERRYLSGHMAPVVRRTQDGERELVELSWGFVLPQPGKAPRRVTNTRDDKTDSPIWRDSLVERRCLVPVTSFCEPNADVIAISDEQDPRPLFAFAGIWRVWNGPVKKDGPAVALDVFSIITTTPNALVETVNHERMPVLLAGEEAQAQWMDGSYAEATALLTPYPPEKMRLVQTGYEKKDLLA